MAPKSLRGVELLLGVTAEAVEKAKNVRSPKKVKIQEAFLSVMKFSTVLMAVKCSDPDWASAGGGNAVLWSL